MKVILGFLFALMVGSSLSDDTVKDPQCMFEENVAACCFKVGLRLSNRKDSLKVGINLFNTKVCMKTTLNLEKTTGTVGIYVDGQVKQETELATGETCQPVGSLLPGVNQCINVYHLVLDTSQKVIESCAFWKIGNLLQVRFACVKFEDGKFSQHNDIQPENYGFITATAEDGGKLVWKVAGRKELNKWWEKTWSSIKKIVSKKSDDPIKRFIEQQE